MQFAVGDPQLTGTLMWAQWLHQQSALLELADCLPIGFQQTTQLQSALFIKPENQ